MTSHWYVFRSKPREETAAWHYLLSQDVTCFYPRVGVKPVNPRARKVKPYFPGYLFVHCDLDQLGNNAFCWMPHSLGLVRFGGLPAVTSVAETDREKLFDFQPGDDVLVKDGPFTGCRAIFDSRLSGQDRVCVLLQMLNDQREVPVELVMGQISKE